MGPFVGVGIGVSRGGAGSGGEVPEALWSLFAGVWDDDGYWVDSATWNDGD